MSNWTSYSATFSLRGFNTPENLFQNIFSDQYYYSFAQYIEDNKIIIFTPICIFRCQHPKITLPLNPS